MNEGCSKLVRNRRAIAMKRFPVSTLRFFFFFPFKNEFSYTNTKEMSSIMKQVIACMPSSAFNHDTGV